MGQNFLWQIPSPEVTHRAPFQCCQAIFVLEIQCVVLCRLCMWPGSEREGDWLQIQVSNPRPKAIRKHLHMRSSRLTPPQKKQRLIAPPKKIVMARTVVPAQLKIVCRPKVIVFQHGLENNECWPNLRKPALVYKGRKSDRK